MRLFQVKGVWYADIHAGGTRVKRSTRCTDKRAAEYVARQWERDAADPDHAAANKATLSDALDALIAHRRAEALAGKKAEATAKFYASKCGHWRRVLETNAAGNHAPFALGQLRARHVDDYIAQRRAEGAAENTIAKELVALRAALKLARRAGIWRGHVDEILPSGFAPEYKPRERVVRSMAEAERLISELSPGRGARVAFHIATSANWSEGDRVRRDHVRRDLSEVTIPGTKRASRHRTVPVVSVEQRQLLAFAVAHADGVGGMLFRPWPNMWRDLQRACERAKLPPITSNDLRRTTATWLRAAGVAPHLIAPVMGHVDSRMVERVYGRMSTAQLAERLTVQIGEGKGRRPHFVQSTTESED